MFSSPTGFEDLLRAFLIAILFLGAPLAAQEIVRETQVAIDPDRGVTEIGPDLRRELGLFPGVAGFQVARLFRQDDGTLVLEIARVEGGGIVRERQRLGADRLAAFRADLGGRLSARGQSRAVDRSGRSGLVLAETLLGVGLYGWAIPSGLDIDSDRGQVATYLLTAGLSFYLPYRITRNASVSVAERNAAVWGGTRGIVHGATLAELINGPDEPYDPSRPFEESNDGRVQALSMLGASVLETVLAYQSVSAADTDDGEVAFWGAAGDFGIPAGFGLAYLAGMFERDVQVCDFSGFCYGEDRWRRGGHAVALAVALASPVVAHATGAGARYTIGDARALRSFGLLGAQVALAPARAAFRDDEEDGPDKPTVAALMAGASAGLWLGNRALASRSLSGGDGLLVMAGHLAGGLGALGLTYLADSGERGDELIYMTTSALGSVAGSLLTLRAVSGGPADLRGAAAGSRLEMTPAGALLPLLAGANGRAVRAPLLTLRF